jgi:hypothetical protein
MPSFFRGEAVHTAMYLLNQSPMAALDGLTPYQAWYGKKPSVHFLRVFGCVAESPSLVLVINDTKLLMPCVKCFELGISNTCDEGVRGKEWWPQDHKEMVHEHEMMIMVEMHII